jgi:hydroxymethylbilane synthase
VRIGTRGSDLALWQARHVAARLAAVGCETEIVVLVTRGDRIDDVPLQSVAGKGFFTAEIELALRERRIDLAVHSHKDLPSTLAADLVIAAVPARAALHERLLVAPHAHEPDALFVPLARRARVGTSAPRRTEQLRALRPDLRLEPLRGNVPTRVRRLREGRYDAILLASAGLDRLDLPLDGLVDQPLAAELVVPAPAQGALALEVRAEDEPLRALLARELDDPETHRAVTAERALLVALGGGCNLPLGVAVTRRGNRHRVVAFLGPDQPAPSLAARWCAFEAESPEAAVRRAGECLVLGRPTGMGPLAGLRVALTGSAGSAGELARRLIQLGAEVVREVALEVEDLERPDLARRVAALRPGEALAVTSANAARRLAGVTLPAGVRLAAVGAATAQALEQVGLQAELVGQAGARALAAALAPSLGTGGRVLFPCAEGARDELEEELRRAGVAVERLELYRTRLRGDLRLDTSAAVRLYLSPSAVTAALPAERAASPSARRVALGPSTAAALAEAGFPATTSPSNTTEDVLGVIVHLWKKAQELLA